MTVSFAMGGYTLSTSIISCRPVTSTAQTGRKKLAKTKSPMQKFTLMNFQKAFPSDDACLEYIRFKRYPERIDCPSCGKNALFHKIRGRKSYACDFCGYQIAPAAGTIFEKSSTPLSTWFYVIYQMAQTRCGISAKQIERETGVTYKTAWRMSKEIRKALNGEYPQDPTTVFGRT